MRGNRLTAVPKDYASVHKSVSHPLVRSVRFMVVEPRAFASPNRLNLDGETRVALEHTGRYYESVAGALSSEGIYVSAVNPLLIKEYGNNSIRKVKTDKADALKIARYGLDNWAELREHTPMDNLRVQLKILNRQYSLYTKNKTALKNNLIALLDQSYPGANAYFNSPVRADGSQKWGTSPHPFGT